MSDSTTESKSQEMGKWRAQATALLQSEKVKFKIDADTGHITCDLTAFDLDKAMSVSTGFSSYVQHVKKTGVNLPTVFKSSWEVDADTFESKEVLTSVGDHFFKPKWRMSTSSRGRKYPKLDNMTFTYAEEEDPLAEMNEAELVMSKPEL